jgi:ATP/maltotriose-dependent transcriptional regulator MalT
MSTPTPVRLTKRETQVLSLIAKGCSSQEMAENLHVSKRTIDFHLANLYSKLHVKNRFQAFHAALKLGLLTAELLGLMGA